jgi:hypothetical protein
LGVRCWQVWLLLEQTRTPNLILRGQCRTTELNYNNEPTIRKHMNQDHYEKQPLMGIRVGSSFIRIVRSRRPDQVIYLVKFPPSRDSYKRRCKGLFSREAAVTFARGVALGMLAQSPLSTTTEAPLETGL